MHLMSPAYADGATMPVRFAKPPVAGGGNRSVPLEWSGEPAGTESFALAMIDHHPVAHRWVHWLVVDVPASVHELAEGASGTSAMPGGAKELTGTGGRSMYEGPLPPVGSGVHDYMIAVYALDTASLGLAPDASWDDARTAIQGHLIDDAALLGRFGR